MKYEVPTYIYVTTVNPWNATGPTGYQQHVFIIPQVIVEPLYGNVVFATNMDYDACNKLLKSNNILRFITRRDEIQH